MLYDEDKFCGIAYYVISDSTVYLTYLAVNKDLRGQGYGTKILSLLEKQYPDQAIVIDIEPVVPTAKNYQQRVSRLKFYERNGFHRTDQKLKDQDEANLQKKCNNAPRMPLQILGLNIQ